MSCPWSAQGLEILTTSQKSSDRGRGPNTIRQCSRCGYEAWPESFGRRPSSAHPVDGRVGRRSTPAPCLTGSRSTALPSARCATAIPRSPSRFGGRSFTRWVITSGSATRGCASSARELRATAASAGRSSCGPGFGGAVLVSRSHKCGRSGPASPSGACRYPVSTTW